MKRHCHEEVNQIEALTIRSVNAKMMSLSAILALLVPVPAVRDASQKLAKRHQKREVIARLRWAPHLLRDIGFDEPLPPPTDPRWVDRSLWER